MGPAWGWGATRDSEGHKVVSDEEERNKEDGRTGWRAREEEEGYDFTMITGNSPPSLSPRKGMKTGRRVKKSNLSN